MSDFDSGLYPDGTVGSSGSSTSAERAVAETLSPRRAKVYAFVSSKGAWGATVAEVERGLGIGHGSASGALTVLHRGGDLTRLTWRRNRQEVYVLPQHVNGREEAPYRPNTGKARIAELEQALSSARQASDDLHHILRSGYADIAQAHAHLSDVQERLEAAVGTNRVSPPAAALPDATPAIHEYVLTWEREGDPQEHHFAATSDAEAVEQMERFLDQQQWGHLVDNVALSREVNLG